MGIGAAGQQTYLLLELLDLLTMFCADMLQDKILANKHLGAELVAPPVQHMEHQLAAAVTAL